jgi:hypothetical protein
MMGTTAPFMVMETDISPSGIWSNRIFISSTESMATPALPYIAHHARVIGIVAPVGGQVERHGSALFVRRPGFGDKKHCSPLRWKSRRIAGSSRAG